MDCQSPAAISSAAESYIGRKVRLWPSDTWPKEAVIEDVNVLGWTFRVTNTEPCYELFVNHARPLDFRFLD